MNIIEVTIITVNYNGLSDTCELLKTLPLEDPTLEVIVVDNASRTDEAAEIRKRFPRVKTLRSEKNLGFAGGNNLGIRVARGRYLFFINNDTLCYRGPAKPEGGAQLLLEPLIRRLESSDNIGMVCPKIRFAWDDAPIQFAGYTPLSAFTLRNRSIGFGEADHGQYDTPHPTPYAHGAAMMVKREAVDRAGMMPEAFFLYYEELDWSLLIRRAGYEIWYEPASTIFHKESMSTGKNSPLRTYYITRNRLRFVQRNVQYPQKLLNYLYLIGIVGTKDVAKHLLHGDVALAKAVVRGVIQFFKQQ